MTRRVNSVLWLSVLDNSWSQRDLSRLKHFDWRLFRNLNPFMHFLSLSVHGGTAKMAFIKVLYHYRYLRSYKLMWWLMKKFEDLNDSLSCLNSSILGRLHNFVIVWLINFLIRFFKDLYLSISFYWIFLIAFSLIV